MRFNWGHGIFLFFSLFVSVSLYQLYTSRKYMPDLVNENYYLDDIHLKEYITKKANARDLENFSFDFISKEDTIHLFIPHKNEILVDMLFLSPVTKTEDIIEKYKLSKNENKINLSINKLRKGKWNIELKWVDGNTPYLFESKIIKK